MFAPVTVTGLAEAEVTAKHVPVATYKCDYAIATQKVQ